jgi:hypothetical protein
LSARRQTVLEPDSPIRTDFRGRFERKGKRYMLRTAGRLLLLGVLIVGGSAKTARADVITGAITNWTEYTQFAFGDSTNDVTGYWTLGSLDWAWVYGAAYATGSDVAYASTVTDISQLTDASSLTFTSLYSLVPDAHGGGVGAFVVLRNTSTGHYGAMHIEEITMATVAGASRAVINGTWWFQTDGSANLSPAASVPEPTSLALMGSGAIALLVSRRRRSRG